MFFIAHIYTSFSPKDPGNLRWSLEMDLLVYAQDTFAVNEKRECY